MEESNTGSTLFDQRSARLEKLQKLRTLGIDPFPAHSNKDYPNQKIKDEFDHFDNTAVTVAGKLTGWREHGGVIFGDIVDDSGTLQLYLKKDLFSEHVEPGHLTWNQFDLLDLGDFIEVHGTVTKTTAGEISILAQSVRILTKTLRPLPEELTHKEQRYRRRYVDLWVNPDVKARFMRKAAFWQANRRFMEKQGFIEVETPVLEHVTGGADARPFETYHNDLDQKLYMRISTELFQKRLIGGGLEKIYTLGPNFRNEGVSDEHLQEYYQLEWYWAYADYRKAMDLTKELFRYIANEVYGTTRFETRGHIFDLGDEWEEIDYVAVIKEKLGIDIFEDSDEVMSKALKEQGVTLTGEINRNRLIDNLWKVIRKTIAGPAFLVNEPKFMSPLAKSKEDDARLTQRFHVLLAGSELANGYSELNDPLDQLERFVEQQALRDTGDEEAQMLDIDYVEMLEYGMPPTAGYGHSERVFWFLEDVTAREGTLFPLMKEEYDSNTKKIYQNILPKDEGVAFSQNDLVGLPQRDEALALLEQHVGDTYQKLHAKMVATAMESYATVYGEDLDLWYITGLLHDLDYFEFPEEHPKKSLEWFKELHYPEALQHAVAAHAHFRTDVKPQTTLAKALVAVDEMAGLLYAYSLMREDGFSGMQVSSAKKKFKDKSFAAKIDRDEILWGVELLGISLEDHIERLINVYQTMEEFKNS